MSFSAFSGILRKLLLPPSQRILMAGLNSNENKKNTNFPLLSPGEEYQLGIEILNGDEDAVAELALGNLALVLNIANRYKNRGLPVNELVEAGNIGLMLAAKVFNPHKGRFSSIATEYIEGEIKKSFSDNICEIKLTRGVTVLIKDINECINNGITTDACIASKLGIDKQKVRKALSTPRLSKNIDEKNINDNPNEKSLIQMVMASEQKSIVASLLSIIPKQKDKEIIIMRFGLNGEDPMCRHDVARYYNVTDEAIRQKEKKVLEHLNLALKKQNITLDILFE